MTLNYLVLTSLLNSQASFLFFQPSLFPSNYKLIYALQIYNMISLLDKKKKIALPRKPIKCYLAFPRLFRDILGNWQNLVCCIVTLLTIRFNQGIIIFKSFLQIRTEAKVVSHLDSFTELDPKIRFNPLFNSGTDEEKKNKQNGSTKSYPSKMVTVWLLAQHRLYLSVVSSQTK